MSLKERVDELLRDHRLYHDDVQLGNFIIAPVERTAFGAYRQCLRELHRRYRGLKTLYIERRRLRLRILGCCRWGWLPWGREKRRLRLCELRMGLEELDGNITDTAREFGVFLHHAEALKQRLGGLGPKRRRELELHQWEHELAVNARLDLVATGAIGRGTVGAIANMPEDSVKRIEEQIGLQERLRLPVPCHDARVKEGELPPPDSIALSTAVLDVDA
jgi:hypothetical protein